MLMKRSPQAFGLPVQKVQKEIRLAMRRGTPSKMIPWVGAIAAILS